MAGGLPIVRQTSKLGLNLLDRTQKDATATIPLVMAQDLDPVGNDWLKFPPFFGQVAKLKKSDDNLPSEDGRE
jgi:hypothetical protein